MKRWIITEVEGEKQFLIKNMLIFKKIDTNLKLTTQNGEIDITDFSTGTRSIYLWSHGHMIILYKRNNYKINSGQTYRVYHACFDELLEWIKRKKETDFIL